MRGRRHTLRLIGHRLASGPDVGEVYRDGEGRWLKSPNDPPLDLNVREVIGFVGFPAKTDTPDGQAVDAAAHLPLGTVVLRGDELEAYGTGNPNLDGRYEIIGVGQGRAMIRVTLRRYQP
jgi:hypothetical protein